MATIEIKPLYALPEMKAAVELQRTYWGDDVESVIPAHMLFSLATNGGHVLAAFDGEHMVGVLVGFLGTNMEEQDRPAMANLHFVSKRMVILPEYRGQGIGYKLKLAQRSLAMRQGVRLVVWTFDPLLAANAHLNIRKLGGISYRYLEDYYGTTDDGGLAKLGSSDRLHVEWWVTNRRVEERITGTRGDLSLKQYLDAYTPIVNPALFENDLPHPIVAVSRPNGSLVLLEIPARYEALAERDPQLAQAWRSHTRDVFKLLFSLGFVVTDFLHEPFEGRERAFYLLSQTNTRQFEQVDFSRN
ncbi:MAG: GNAT family N-acetyltransferase [Chloroflexi bacterium]|nr:GNAT family N-acetyltransferase [Chloroflexota bacterium]